ncbi:hypothetical protein D8X55_04790, partial [Malacoplasma penetrans]
NWLVNLGNNNSEYKTLLDNKRNSINNSYNDSVKSYKKTHGSNWELKFQQEVLDPNGGTKEAYINSQLYSFARSTFTDKLFSTFYLSIYDTSKNEVVIYPTKENILDALKNSSGITNNGTNANQNLRFKFDNKVDLTADANEEPNKSFAAFQDYIYQKYVEYENPYIVDNVQWNYSTPSGSDGINSLYKIPTNSSSGEGDSNSGDSSGNSSGDSSSGGSTASTSSFVTRRSNSTSEAVPTADDDSSSGDSGDSDSDSSTTTTANSGSYAFPYFGNENGTNSSYGTVTKFVNFLNGSSTTSNYITNTDTGLKSIDKIHTDGDSTLKLVKNSTIFNDQSAEYASAVSYLYGVLSSTNGTTNGTSQMTDIKGQITHNIDLTSATNGLDYITSNFVSTSNLYTSSSGSTPSINSLLLPKEYLSNIINPNGSLSALSSNNLYVVDNFIPGTIKTSSSSTATGNPLDKFMFFRSSTGVEAVSIDGSTVIEKATTVKDKKAYAANVVLYRYFMGSEGHSNFTIDLSSELSTFFSSNIDWLIYQYINEGTNFAGIDGTSTSQTMFNLSEISANDQTLARAISFFVPASTYYNNIYSAAEKMYAAKKTYNQNYGYSVYSNGLASNFNYNYGQSTDAQNNYVNPNIFYENTLVAATANSPYLTTATSKNVNATTGSSGTSGSLYQQVLNSISSVVSNINKQDADYNRYTQYLYSTNYYVNAAMTSVLSNTGYVSAEIQNPILNNYIGSFYSVTNGSNRNSFSLSANPFSTSNSSDSTSTGELQTYLQNAMYNFFFLSNYTGESNSLISFGATTNTKSSSSISTSNNATNLLGNIRSYSFDLWNDNNSKDISTQASNYNTLYRTVASIKYLLGTDLSNFLQYMRSYVGNEKAYVAWQNSENTNVGALKTGTTTYTTPTSQSLITQSNLSINTNNAIYGNYVGKSPYTSSSSGGGSTSSPANAYNLDTNTSYQSSINTSYFSITSNSFTSNGSSGGGSNSSVNTGFMGLQLSSSNSLPSDVANALFTKPYDYNIGTTGVYYQYGTKENLKSEITNTITLANLTTLATNLDSLTNYAHNLTGIINSTKSLNEKKADLINVVDSLSEEEFKQFKGYVGNSVTSGSTTTINSYSSDATSVAKYGTYAIELKASDFNSLSSLQTALGASSGNAESYKLADEIICNLIVQYASQANNQTYWISNIVGNNKINIYDIRAYNAISSDGITWVRNFKTISK